MARSICIAFCLLLGACSADPQDPHYNGAAALYSCSGALFRFDNQNLEDLALVLTNGHCIGSNAEEDVVVARPNRHPVRLFNGSKSLTPVLYASETVYATMLGTDIAVLRLDVSYQHLEDQFGVDAFVLSDHPGDVGEDIIVVSGLTETRASCELDGFVHSLREDQWEFLDTLRLGEACQLTHGTSGSPIVSVATGEIVGVSNTASSGGDACALNNPCEVTADGEITVIPNRSYGQQTYHFYSCVDADYQLDLDLDGCSLPKPLD